MNFVLNWIITAKQPFDFSKVKFYIKGFNYFFFSMDRLLEGISSLMNNNIPSPLEFQFNLYGSINPFIRKWPFGKLSFSFVSDIMSMSMFPVVISIKLPNFHIIELTFRWPTTIWPRFFWWMSLRLFIFIRERLDVVLYSSQL